jgi:hypothetical protein
MAIRITRDPDNKWYIYIDWNAWIDAQAVASPNGPAMTIAITAVSWTIPTALTEEAETPSNADAGITYFFGSGGTINTDYTITATITYTATSASTTTTKTDLTQSQSVTVRLRDQ